ncbi:MAG: hypothetical protein ACREOU_06940 [Candidatus Eiseniibacteriota bacterium]
MKKTAIALFALAAIGTVAAPAMADGVYQSLPFSQNWSNIALVSADDDWSAVPGIIAYRGDDATTTTPPADAGLYTVDNSAPLDVNANRPDPLTFFTGGATEFELANPVVALTGSGTADGPHLVLHLNTTGKVNITVQYLIRDLEGVGSTDNAQQQVALQYRIGGVGVWTNVPAGYVADATTGPDTAIDTPVSVVLPVGAENQATLQVRILTTNAIGNDEWVGIDDINVRGEDPVPAAISSWGKVKGLYR